jgi:tRNA(Ile)-lysidine synthase
MSHLRRLLQQIEVTNRRHSLIRRGDSLVVGLSGGPDSVALIYLLSKLRRKYSLKIAAAHLDHGLSGQSREYLTTAKKTALTLGVPFYSKKVSVRVSAKKIKRSLEESGRIERYRFFEETAKKTSARKIVTAHTLDDQAETMLMRIFRGSGLRGLSGIPYRRPQGAYVIVRPLLDCSKKELVGFLKENGIPYCTDKTNRDPNFTRNRVRHKILPLIKSSFNPRIDQNLASLRDVCQEAQDYLDREAENAFKRCLRKSSARALSLDLHRLKRLHPAILSETLFKALTSVRGDSKRFVYEHLIAIRGVLNSEEKELELHLPGRIRIKKKDGRLAIALIDTPNN